MIDRNFLSEEMGGSLNRAAFVTWLVFMFSLSVMRLLCDFDRLIPYSICSIWVLNLLKLATYIRMFSGC